MSRGEAAERLRRWGPNELREEARAPALRLLARQFTDVLTVILLLAAAIALSLGDWIEALSIAAIVVLNGTLSFFQEWRAEEALAALRRMLSTRARVIRDGIEAAVDSRDLVPGDLVVLEVGERVPADARLLEASNLSADESLLTGESLPVAKRAGAAGEADPLERPDLVHMSTVVTHGWGRAEVLATGMRTRVGGIAIMTRALGEQKTPLQRRLSALGRQLGLLAVGLAVLVALLGLALGRGLLDMFLTSVAMAVALVPEGLPAVVTLTLALGVRAMARRRALVRRLSAAEGLGAVTVICTDKTGTLTRNEMTVRRIWAGGRSLEVQGAGYAPRGAFLAAGLPIQPLADPDLYALLRIGSLCGHAGLEERDGLWQVIGDATEGALRVAARKAGLTEPGEGAERVSEFSFSSERKRMSVVVRGNEGIQALVKGAPEVILPLCSRVLDAGRPKPLGAEERARVEAEFARLSEAGLRTLAFAQRPLPPSIPLEPDAVERDLTLVGLAGIVDALREGAGQAVEICRGAGIRVVMLTGDAARTAVSVARALGHPAERVVTGSEIDALEDEGLLAVLRDTSVFARISPAHKLRIVTLLQRQGEIVGMTGDGVNDAPALKRADVGIAMGLRGTDVAKGAADLVLLDDDFSTIVRAVREGRRQYENIQKFVRYLLSSNFGEVVALLGGIVLGGPLILLPVQILWMNLITDGLTALALGVEPGERDLMRRPPRAPGHRILSRPALAAIAGLGTAIGAATLWLFAREMSSSGDVERARTLAFTGIILLEKMNVFNFRSARTPLLRLGLMSNPALLGAWIAALALQVAAVYAPPLQAALHTVPLRAADWGLLFCVSVPILAVGEAVKIASARPPSPTPPGPQAL